jgi:ribosomal protein S18 acetylase RimI-like enzyme
MARSPVSVREARRADGPAILALERELADFERLEGPSEAEGTKLLSWIFDEERFHVLVAERGAEVVGIAIYFFFPTSFRARPGLYLEDIVVSNAARGEGVGRALMAELARAAESRDCGRMEWAVLDWNERALDFYRRLGARQHREWLRYSLEAPEIRALAADAERR